MMKYLTCTWQTPATFNESKLGKNKEFGDRVLLYCLGLRAQSPELREVDLWSSPKRGSMWAWLCSFWTWISIASSLQKRTKIRSANWYWCY